MTMPRNLVLIRHGESQGNVAIKASKSGDDSHYTDEFISSPDSRWQLTDIGRAQAACAGQWLTGVGMSFDKHYCSPYTRTRQTAAHLGLPDALWRLNRGLRERDWGDIGTMPKGRYRSDIALANNFRRSQFDPLYWTPPNGESIADVAENRVRNVLQTLHRDAGGQDVLAVTHGETMMSFRLVLERLDDTAFAAMHADKTQTIRNCEVIHYSRTNPADPDGPLSPSLTWRRRARPVLGEHGWVMEVDPWEFFTSQMLTNDDLLKEST